MIFSVTARRRSRRRVRPSSVAPALRSGTKRRDRTAKQISPRRRVLWVWLLLMLAILGLLGRLAHLQLIQGPALLAQARQQHEFRSFNPPPQRYPIVDRSGNVLAIDQARFTLYAHPILFKQNRSAIAAELSPLLAQSPETLTEVFNQRETGIAVAKDLSEEVSRDIQGLQHDGLELVPHLRRFYPQQDLFAGTVGYVDLEGKAQAGLEFSTEDHLLTLAGRQTQENSSNTAPLPPLEQALLSEDLKLQLTLDSRLQRVAQLSLRQQIQNYGAERGAVMVMDATDGALLALVTDPSFDPNAYFEADLDWLKNWAVSDLYEPGSTFKPINIAIALESGVASPDTTVYDSGQITIGKWPIKNADYAQAGGRGMLTLSEMLQHSSNVGMVNLMDKLPAQDYFDWLGKLGLGQATGIDLPAEAIAQLKERSQFVRSRIEPATTSFGQGFALTPIQMMQLHGSLANGGKLITPHVIAGLVNGQNKTVWQPERPDAATIFSPQTTQAVLKTMEDVVQLGTGDAAQIPGYRIAGKTGTAQKALNGYYTQSRITSFVGILPVEQPRYVVLAIVDDPKGDDAYGGTVTAPIVKTVMESLIRLEGIPPSPTAETSP
ncbi:MAG: penicillin-binding protein 2 [Cyanobacteria bacterium P01_D01_bin.128]